MACRVGHSNLRSKFWQIFLLFSLLCSRLCSNAHAHTHACCVYLQLTTGVGQNKDVKIFEAKGSDGQCCVVCPAFYCALVRARKHK